MSQSEDREGGDELKGVDPTLAVEAILEAAEGMKRSRPDITRRLRELATELQRDRRRT